MSVLETSREGRVLRVTLNRPEKKNALSAELCMLIADQVERAADDPEIGCILLEARGDVFCAGMDLSEASERSAELGSVHERLFTLGLRVPKPIVAAVSGPALGGGVGLIANAHVVVAAHGCNFALSEIRVGMWPFVIWRAVANAVSERRATALAMTGRVFGANEALQWGLIHEIAPAFEVDDRAAATAAHLAESAPEAMRLGLQYLSEVRTVSPGEAGAIANRYRAEAFASADFAEGVAAFREKRKPVWRFGPGS